jgi:hypothetical protein
MIINGMVMMSVALDSPRSVRSPEAVTALSTDAKPAKTEAEVIDETTTELTFCQKVGKWFHDNRKAIFTALLIIGIAVAIFSIIAVMIGLSVGGLFGLATSAVVTYSTIIGTGLTISGKIFFGGLIGLVSAAAITSTSGVLLAQHNPQAEYPTKN